MRRIASTFAFVLLAVASASASHPFVGRWVGTPETTVRQPATAEGKAAQQEARRVTEWLSQLRVEIDLKADRTYSIVMRASRGRETRGTGRWTAEGNVVKLWVEFPDGDKQLLYHLEAAKDRRSMVHYPLPENRKLTGLTFRRAARSTK
jgi:hypothetical protein